MKLRKQNCLQPPYSYTICPLLLTLPSCLLKDSSLRRSNAASRWRRKRNLLFHSVIYNSVSIINLPHLLFYSSNLGWKPPFFVNIYCGLSSEFLPPLLYLFLLFYFQIIKLKIYLFYQPFINESVKYKSITLFKRQKRDSATLYDPVEEYYSSNN